MRSDELDFHLPAELIAQSPAERRSDARLLHYRRSDRSITHRTFSDLPRLLRPSDLLVFNDAKVLPARFLLQKVTGGKIEGLFLNEPQPNVWLVLLRNLGDAPSGTILHFTDAPEVAAKILGRGDEGEYKIQVLAQREPLLNRIGRMPLPPYIKRAKDHDDRDTADRERYQTVYAKTAGSIAAPTAGLHFTDSILAQLDAAAVQRIFLTLHVGMGTFKPVTAETLEKHHMHTESYAVDTHAAEVLNRAQTEKQRIIAIGTTAARVLESWPADQPWTASGGETNIFIYPPYQWKRVGAMITNFHLPKSTLIALVAAMVGLEEQRRLYEIAIGNGYRFFSYGDAMFIE